MKASGLEVIPTRRYALNAVPLQSAVLCAECDVVSDSPHDTCLVCGSHSLFNIARMFGGKLPKERARLMGEGEIEIVTRDLFVVPKPHRVRRRIGAGARRVASIAVGENQCDEVESGMLRGPEGR